MFDLFVQAVQTYRVSTLTRPSKIPIGRATSPLLDRFLEGQKPTYDDNTSTTRGIVVTQTGFAQKVPTNATMYFEYTCCTNVNSMPCKPWCFATKSSI